MKILLPPGMFVWFLTSCITPSIPIPPPNPDQMTFEVEFGVARFSYAPAGRYAGANVYIFNRSKGVGVIDTARDDGSVGPTLPMPATLGDQVVVSFARDDETVSTCVLLRQGRQSMNDVCQ